MSTKVPIDRPPGRGVPTGCRPPPGGAPKATGLSFWCNRPGYHIARCKIAPAPMNVVISSSTSPYHISMYYGGGWLQECPDCIRVYTTTRTPPPQHSSSPSTDLEKKPSCMHACDPHPLTTQNPAARRGYLYVVFWGLLVLEETGEKDGLLIRDRFHVNRNP